jgi:hypothetical protein
MLQLSIVGAPVEVQPEAGRRRLYKKVYLAISARLCGAGVDQELLHEAAEAVVEDLTSIPRGVDARKALLLMSGYRPVCWVCGFGIPLDVHTDDRAAFSVDHVVPRSEGGSKLGITNLKPAHRFCNNIRNQEHLRKKTRQRYADFLDALRSRQEMPSA